MSTTMTDRELDALVAEKVKALAWYDIREAKTIYGDQNFVALTYRDDMRGYYEIPHYSTDLAAAFQVVEKMEQKGWGFKLDLPSSSKIEVEFYLHVAHIRDWEEGHGWQATIPLSICHAALQALRIEVPA